MAFYASSFSFAGKASELYNLRIANLDESMSNNSSGQIEILQKFIYKRPKPFFYGIHYADDTQLGVRVPLGLAYLFQTAPVDIFLEIVPILDFIPETDFRINAALGARYYFQ